MPKKTGRSGNNEIVIPDTAKRRIVKLLLEQKGNIVITSINWLAPREGKCGDSYRGTVYLYGGEGRWKLKSK